MFASEKIICAFVLFEIVPFVLIYALNVLFCPSTEITYSSQHNVLSSENYISFETIEYIVSIKISFSSTIAISDKLYSPFEYCKVESKPTVF